jgi:methionine biosynthesis protein MetW
MIPKYHLERFDPRAAHPYDSHTLQVRHIPAGARVLELGCASGYMSAYLEAEKGCQVVGLDHDPDAIAIAATRAHAAFLADLEADDPLAVARPYAPFDVLYAANVLEHVRNAGRVLRAAHALLRPGALVVVTLPNIAHWQVRLRLLAGRFDYTDYGIMDRTHVHFYTLATARALLNEAGYTVQRVDIAGSLAQNALRRLWPGAPLLLPGLLAYEMILVAARP